MFTGRSSEPLRGPVAHGTTYDQLEHNTMQHSLVYASKSTLPSNEANAVHVVQMCDAFASQLQTVVLRGKRGAAHCPIEELYGLRNQFRVVYESAISRKLWLHALRLRAWLFGVSPGVIYYGRRMNALCALAAAGYPTALELHHPPRGSAQSAQLQAFAVQDRKSTRLNSSH